MSFSVCASAVRPVGVTFATWKMLRDTVPARR